MGRRLFKQPGGSLGSVELLSPRPERFFLDPELCSEQLPPPRECHPPLTEPLQGPLWLRAFGCRRPAGLLSRSRTPCPFPVPSKFPGGRGASAASYARLSRVSGPRGRAHGGGAGALWLLAFTGLPGMGGGLHWETNHRGDAPCHTDVGDGGPGLRKET